MNGNHRDKDKRTVILLVKKLPTLYGPWWFTAAFKNTHHCTDELYQYLKHLPALGIISVHVVGLPYQPCFGLSSDQILYTYLFYHMHVTRSTCHTFLYLFTHNNIWCRVKKVPFICQLPGPSSLLDSNIHIGTLFPNKLMIKISRDWSCSTIRGKFQIVGNTP